MEHIIADIVFLLVGLGIVFLYAHRGFLKSLFHSLKIIFAFIITYFLGGKVAQFLCDKWIGNVVRDFVFDKLNGMYLKAAESFNAENVISSVPEFLLTDEMRNNLLAAEGTGEQMVQSMTDSISAPVSTVISNIIGYVVVFVVALVVLWIAAVVLDKLVEHIKLLNAVNTLLGAVLGLLIAVSLMFVVASVLKFFLADSAIYAESVIIKFFGNSSLLEALKFLNIGNLFG